MIMKKLCLLPTLLFLWFIGYGQQCNWILTTTDLSEPKEGMGVAVLPGSDTFWFAGGYGDINETNKVEIYNAVTETWSYSLLSQARSWPAGLAHNGHIFFAGGMFWSTGQATSRVDIWNNETAQWTTAELSVPRLSTSAVGIGNKAMFAGGVSLTQSYDVVDIYDFTTGQWSTAKLSKPRAAMGSAVVETPNGPIALFAGGLNELTKSVTDQVDIYHYNTDTWSTTTLSEARGHLSATTVGYKVVFAGGITNDNLLSDRVDIYDAFTGEWTTANLSAPRCTDMTDGLTKTVCGKVWIVGGCRIDLNTGEISDASNVIDIYDPTTDIWSVEYLSKPLATHSVASNGMRLLVAGGRNTQSFAVYDEVDIYNFTSSTEERKTAAVQFRIYPNPSAGCIFLDQVNEMLGEPRLIRVLNLQGQVVHHGALAPGERELKLSLPPGAYMLSVSSDNANHAEILVIQH
jgi:hypothetical protein